MKIKLGFSPCPNDTFIFDALLHGRIDTGGLEIEAVIADVEALNRMAFRGELEVTKLSFHALLHLTDRYQLLNAGSALGRNCGPLLIAKGPLSKEEIEAGRIAIPGQYTTAYFLFRLAYPQATDISEMIFSEIEQAVLDGQAAAGLIIHENRFTYAEKGLHKIADLGEYWETLTGKPIPLGGIVVRRDLPGRIRWQVDQVMRRSVELAFQEPAAAMPFVREHAQEMDEQVMQQHIQLYVNDFTLDLGVEGREAVQTLYAMARQKGLTEQAAEDLFVC